MSDDIIEQAEAALEADAKFMAEARTLVPALVAELKAAREDQRRWRRHKAVIQARQDGWMS
jgi:hypothetical protein